MTRPHLAAAVYEASHLIGPFTLRSGQQASEYFDKYQFTSRPELLEPLADQLAILLPPEVEVVAGLQMGGVPLAAAVALTTGLPAVYVRLSRKTYGTCKITEGIEVLGRRVAIIEDVVTTGGQVILSAEDLRRDGAIVEHVLAVVDREMGGAGNLGGAGLELRAVFTATDLRPVR